MTIQEQQAEANEARQLLLDQELPITPELMDRARRAVRRAWHEEREK